MGPARAYDRVMTMFSVTRLADQVIAQTADDDAFNARHAADAQSREVIVRMRAEGERRAYAMAVAQLETHHSDARRFEPDEL